MGIQDEDVTDHDITSTGTVAKLEPRGKAMITTVVEDAGSAATYALQVREKGGTWRTYHDFGSVSSIQDSRELSASEVRLQITSGGTSGTADAYFAAGD